MNIYLHVFFKSGNSICLLIWMMLLINFSVDAKPIDTLHKLEIELIQNLKQIQQKIFLETIEFNQLSVKKNTINITRKELSSIKKQLTILENQRIKHYQIQNAFNYLLTTLRQIQYQKEKPANKQLKEIKSALIQLKKNKLPSFKNQKKISTNEFIRDEILVYDKPINSFCNLTKNAEGTILANAYEVFFEYTDPKIASYFKENEFLQCMARLIKTKNDYLLELKFILRSSKASALYGAIDPSSPSRIDFINGEHIYIQSYALTSGVIEAHTGNTLFNIQYKLDREDLKFLKKQDIDSFTIIWTTGADRFEICNLDLLKNMFECLSEKKLQN